MTKREIIELLLENEDLLQDLGNLTESTLQSMVDDLKIEPRREEDETTGDDDCTTNGYYSDYIGYVNTFLS